jgi:hypothetical protein
MASTHRFLLIVPVGLSALIVLTAENVAAQDVAFDGPVVACPAILLLDAVPANLEWSYWMTGGGGLDTASKGARLGVIGAGVEATTQLATATRQTQYGGPFEFRGGPWWNIVSDFSGVRAEGGYVLSFGQVQHAQWGTYAVRVGGGLGDDRLGLSPHFVVTLTGGIRYAGERYSERGACDPKPGPKSVAMADHFRLFATARSTLADGAPWQLTFGVEFSPTFFLPPYSLGKWIGARP